MDDGRRKNVTTNGKGVHKGEKVDTGGPVGRADGYASRQDSGAGRGPSAPSGGGRGPSGGGRPSGAGFGGGFGGGGFGGGAPIKLTPAKMVLGLIVVVLIIVVLVYIMNNADLGGLVDDPGSAQQNQQNQQSPQGGGIASLLGFTGGSAQSAASAWDSGLKNTGNLNTSVADGARERYTTIKGSGKDTITIMVYTCGTDLESKSAMASNDIAEMCNATLSDNIKIVLYTGGCKQWKTSGISSSVNQIYLISGGKLKRLVEDDGAKAMTDPATLTSFIKYCTKNYPANRNMLIFWDHGGGSVSGYGYDEKFARSGSMNLTNINKALKNAGTKFDFIGFDACLMATLETALVCSNYADYLIASEETEPGIGWYYTDWLTELSKNTSQPTIEIGKNIIDSFVEECARRCRGQQTTLSIVDLAELSQTVPPTLMAFSEDTAGMIKGSDFGKVSDARALTREFAASSGIDQIDLVNFASKVGTDEADKLISTLLSAVKYNRTSDNMTNAYGISIYFPYKKTNRVDSVVSTYPDIGMTPDYGRCIKAFAGVETGGQVAAGGTHSPVESLSGNSPSGGISGADILGSLINSFLTGGRSVPGLDRSTAGYMDDINVDDLSQYIAANQFDTSKLVWMTDEKGRHLLELADDQWALIKDLQVNMFYDDGEGYIDLGLDNLYEFENGRLVGDTDNTWLSIDGQPVAYYYETTARNGSDVTIIGRVPALVDGVRCNLIIVFDTANPDGYIAGARYDYVDGETDTVAKACTQIEEGAKIVFLCDYYGYDGTYESSYTLGEPLSYKEGLLISNTDVGGGTKITYLLTDLYNNEYWTPPINQ